MMPTKIELRQGDALIIVDVQKDFLPGGSLAVPQGDDVLPVLNQYIEHFQKNDLPIFATRDWHPPDHCSFKFQGGPWPPHCVQHTVGAEFADALALPPPTAIISKATTQEQDAYSGFQKTELVDLLKAQAVTRLFIGGLATDYCVLHTVKDALAAGFDVIVLRDAVRAVDVQPGDGDRALEQMTSLGAEFVDLGALIQ